MPVVEPAVVEWSVALLPKPQVPVPQSTETAVAPVAFPMLMVWATALSPMPRVPPWLCSWTLPVPPCNSKDEVELVEPTVTV